MSSPELDAFLGSRPRRPVNHWLSIGALLAALALAFVLLGRFVNGPDLPYYTAPVERGDLTPALSTHGTLHAAGEVTLRATTEGTVLEVPGPAEGPIAAGQLLVTMDNAALLAGLAQAQADAAQARGDTDKAQVALTDTTTRLDRYDGVWRRSQHRVPSLNEMETARAQVSRAIIALDTARARQSATQQQVRAAQTQLARAQIVAPFAGSVVARLITPGQSVQSGTPLFTMAPRSDRLTVQVTLTAAQAQRLPPHARARVLAPALSDGPRPATLDHVEAAAASDDGQRLAILTLDGPAAPLRPGMAVTAQIDLPTRPGVLLVPDAALVFAPPGARPGSNVWLLGSDHQPRQIPVAVEASDGKRTEVIASGLEPGAQIITGWRHSPGAQTAPATVTAPTTAHATAKP